MKAFIKILFLGGVVFTLSSCYTSSQGTVYRDGVVIRTNNRGHLPPGQAKKVYGGEARDYAPGQQKKKHYKYHKNEHKKGKGKSRR